jgi:ADP-heptose:LPS heptosyltransferase
MFVLSTAICIVYPFVKIVDYFRGLNKRNLDNKVLKILIINNAKIGDVVCTTPVYRAIKNKYPESLITLMINPKVKGILNHNPRIDYVVDIPKSPTDLIKTYMFLLRNRFDISLTLVPGTINYILPFLLCIPLRIGATAIEYGNYYRFIARCTMIKLKRLNPNELSVSHYLKMLNFTGVFEDDLKKEVFYSKADFDKSHKFLIDYGWDGDSKLIGISFTAGNKIKEWPFDRFVEVAKLIFRKYHVIPVFVCTPKEQVLIDKAKNILDKDNIPHIFATNFSLSELPALLAHLSYFLSVDTGTLYIANALDIPVIDIAGPCNIYDQMPIYEKCEAVYLQGLKGWPYSSVLKTVENLTEYEKISIIGISVEMVFHAFENLKQKYDR